MFPLRNVLQVRVLPYADRVEWSRPRHARRPTPSPAPVVAPYRRRAAGHLRARRARDGGLAEWFAWLEDDARATFARWVLTHPGYLVTEPYEALERTFNNAGGDRQFYAFPDRRKVPLVDGVLAQRSWIVVLVGRRSPAGPSGGAGSRPPSWPGPSPPLALPHGAVAWHSDGMETARHLVIPASSSTSGCCSCSSGCCGPAPRPVPDPGAEAGAEAGDDAGRFGPWLTRPRCPSTTPSPAPWAAWSSSRRCSASPPHRGRRQRLADAGWLAVAPHLFWRTGDPSCPTTTSARCGPTSGR